MSINHDHRVPRTLRLKQQPCQVLRLFGGPVSFQQIPDGLIVTEGDVADVLQTLSQTLQPPALPLVLGISARLDHDGFAEQLGQLMRLRPDALLLTDVAEPADSQRLDALLRVEEARLGIGDGETPVIALLGGDPAGFFKAAAIAASSRRLIGLGLDEASVCTAIGAASAQSTEPVLETCRSLVQLAAAATGLPALIRPTGGPDGLKTRARALAKRGFSTLICDSDAWISAGRAAFAGPDRASK
ncbi:aldolase/citrate lyase family protein [Allorhizobium taibaishanense]|uniref:Citrate lyase beta subunit n=1 Tax=Allorhizobium taibaishanense TaxID=887144 RepID=A0A1Q9A1M2_9HYPH|nr:aldolase/citrate lyase family protein [Allorhizobium taibaishanense]MBB4008031.1 citrate lyase beta subunit [Allorhizobium taibaishanense]OLP48338.1 hypothetical protein BJF91_09450 [Allorhizobium taibaishanense]